MTCAIRKVLMQEANELTNQILKELKEHNLTKVWYDEKQNIEVADKLKVILRAIQNILELQRQSPKARYYPEMPFTSQNFYLPSKEKENTQTLKDTKDYKEALEMTKEFIELHNMAFPKLLTEVALKSDQSCLNQLLRQLFDGMSDVLLEKHNKSITKPA